MKFILYFQKTALHIAVEKNCANIVQLLLDHKDVDVNVKSIFINCNLIQFH